MCAGLAETAVPMQTATVKIVFFMIQTPLSFIEIIMSEPFTMCENNRDDGMIQGKILSKYLKPI